MINPFAAPVFYEETVATTMTVSRELAAQGHPHGTVIAADFQEAGRGRTSERIWETEKGQALAFTVLLRYAKIAAIPRALTLRAGLAVCLAIEDFSPALKGRVRIKWPNDIMADSRKICGILSESDGQAVYIGIGVNVCQAEFPPHLRGKAASIRSESGADIAPHARFALLEKILARLYAELEEGGNALPDSVPGVDSWRGSIEARLYKKGEQVSFVPGAASSDSAVTGTLAGIGPAGELLLTPDGSGGPLSFFSGELRVY